MKKEIVQTGPTVEEAIQSACMLLGVNQEDCEFEIINLPKSTFFGLKKIPAKVRVWIEIPDVLGEKPGEEPFVTEELEEYEEIVVEIPRKPREKSTSSVQPITYTNQELPLITITTPEQASIAHTDMADQDMRIEMVREYVEFVVTHMGLQATVNVVHKNEKLVLNIQGDHLGALIGRRGETLNALQYLAGLVANRKGEGFLRVIVDAGDYRNKRKSSLAEVVEKAAKEVLESNTSKIMEPMTASERHIVHEIVSHIEGVSSVSIGTDPNRRVVIKSATSKMPKQQAKRRNYRNPRKKE